MELARAWRRIITPIERIVLLIEAAFRWIVVDLPFPPAFVAGSRETPGWDRVKIIRKALKKAYRCWQVWVSIVPLILCLALFIVRGWIPRWTTIILIVDIVLVVCFARVHVNSIRRHMGKTLLEAFPGRCPHCGYDIRATPDQCPECGQKLYNPPDVK